MATNENFSAMKTVFLTLQKTEAVYKKLAAGLQFLVIFAT